MDTSPPHNARTDDKAVFDTSKLDMEEGTMTDNKAVIDMSKREMEEGKRLNSKGRRKAARQILRESMGVSKQKGQNTDNETRDDADIHSQSRSNSYEPGWTFLSSPFNSLAPGVGETPNTPVQGTAAAGPPSLRAASAATKFPDRLPPPPNSGDILRKEVDTLWTEMEKVGSNVKQVENDLRSAKRETADLRQSLAAIRAEMTTLSAETTSLRAEMTSLRVEMDVMRAERIAADQVIAADASHQQTSGQASNRATTTSSTAATTTIPRRPLGHPPVG